ncbi:hypothetical protein E3P96_01027 [Wallemia ichthyophaga]|nr:hypothetical protein E3P96_01027 [Wallemia ichthyophaga]
MTARQYVVIGGGIIGSSTAYYISKHSQFNPDSDKITIVESTAIASAASGKSGGFLAEDWHGPDTEGLAELSYSLHKQLSDEYDGVNNWEYRPVNALSLMGQVGPKKGKVDDAKKKGAHWLSDKVVDKCSVLGTPPSTAQVTPEPLVQTLAELSKADVVIASAEQVNRDNDGNIFSVRAQTKEGNSVEIPATDVVLAAGPWTGRLAQKLLSPAEARKCSVTGQRAHSIIVRPSQGKTLTDHCLFTMVKERTTTHEPEIYCRPQGTAYICGASDTVPLPEDASKVVPSKSAIADLKSQSALISDYFDSSMSVEKEQACYLPISASHSPIVGKVSDGVFIGAGHAVWGITLGVGGFWRKWVILSSRTYRYWQFVRYAHTLMSSTSLIAGSDLNDANPQTLIAMGILKGNGLAIDEDTLEPLTEGRHGLLYRCQRRVNDNIGGINGWIALKAVNVFINKKRLPHDALRESFILSRTHHPNIISLLNAYESDRIYILALPLQPLPLSMILSYPDFVPSFSPFTHIARSIIYQLLLAIEYLHSSEVGVAHRDVNPSNVALDGNGCVKLLDFGVAYEDGLGMENEHPNGGMFFELATGAYRAPELIFGSRCYDARSTDLWSLGVTISTFFAHLSSYTCPASPRTDSTSSISSSISSSSQGGLTRLDAPITLPSLPDIHNRRDSSHNAQPQSRWSRKTLFDASYGEIGLASSIISVRGPITDETWPEYATLPDYNKISFNKPIPNHLSNYLPYLPEVPDPVPNTFMHTPNYKPIATIYDLIERLLQYSSARRLSATDAINHPWISNFPILVPAQGTHEDYSRSTHSYAHSFEGKTLPMWLSHWLKAGERRMLGTY